MPAFDRIRSGIPGMDEAFDNIRLGDNVVFRVSNLSDFRCLVLPYVRQARVDGRKIIYVRFATHTPILNDEECRAYGIKIVRVTLSHRFETFTVDIHNIIRDEGEEAFYVFDCLSVLMTAWATDLMMGNFFRVTCPYLFELNTIAYFPLLRGRHSLTAIAKIQDTTQLFIDVYPDETRQDILYVRPDKIWNRYSETMFLPHVFETAANNFRPILDGVEASFFYQVLGKSQRSSLDQNTDSWDRFFTTTRLLYEEGEDISDRMKRMCGIMMTRDEHMRQMIRKNFTPEDYFAVKEKMIGTGLIGGKACGMLTARKIIENRRPDIYAQFEPHDSFYVGSDVFYSYLVDNGLWDLRVRQRTPEGYFSLADEMAEKMKHGTFSAEIEQRILLLLDYYGQDPYIVRSSSILEDGFGNAFAGKYESVFCANQGTKEDRLHEFENAARTVYASTMSPSALDYRKKRGLQNRDEQMALLVMRVSGTHYGPYFMPCAAGVGYSTSPYRIREDMDPKKGMLRLVMGLGTSAVDRTEGSYPRIVNLDKPTVTAASTSRERHEFSQRSVELISKKERAILRVTPETIAPLLPSYIRDALFEHDWDAERQFSSMGRPRPVTFVSCRGLVRNEELMTMLRDMLATIEEEYQSPVDTEFTINLSKSRGFVVNLLQCRPLQMLQNAGAGTGNVSAGASSRNISYDRPPAEAIRSALSASESDLSADRILLDVEGATMGMSVTYPISTIVYVDPEEYYALPYAAKSKVAAQIGEINRSLSRRKSDALTCSGQAVSSDSANSPGGSKSDDSACSGQAVSSDSASSPVACKAGAAACSGQVQPSDSILLVPGRVGTSSPELGVPTTFADISEFRAICEISRAGLGYNPELSYGSHIFQDLVEAGILYVAIFESSKTRSFHPEFLRESPRFAEGSPVHVLENASGTLIHDMQTNHAVITLHPPTESKEKD